MTPTPKRTSMDHRHYLWKDEMVVKSGCGLGGPPGGAARVKTEVKNDVRTVGKFCRTRVPLVTNHSGHPHHLGPFPIRGRLTGVRG